MKTRTPIGDPSGALLERAQQHRELSEQPPASSPQLTQTVSAGASSVTSAQRESLVASSGEVSDAVVHGFAPTLEQLARSPAGARRAGALSQLDARSAASPALFVGEQAQRLRQARARVGQALAQASSSPAEITALCRAWTHEVDELTRALDRQVTAELGEPPSHPEHDRAVGYCLFGVGSFGRGEMSLYSDLDYGLMLEVDTPEVRQHFTRYATRLSELLLQIEDEDGIHACDELSPTGLLGDALVDTPQTLAARLVATSADMKQRSLHDQVYIQSALSAARAVVASPEGSALFAQFTSAADSALGPAAPRLEPGSGRASALARVSMGMRDPFGVPAELEHWFEVPGGGIDTETARAKRRPKHVPVPPDEAIDAGRVNIKHDLLRAMQIPLQALRTAYGVGASSGDELLAELDQRGHIDHHFADKLRDALAACMRLRLVNDFVAGHAENMLQELSPADRRAIRRMVPLLYRLRQEMERLLDGDPNQRSLGA